jgi:hypothetical protein
MDVADDELFFQLVADILARATKNGRKVRAFGEMVTVMWAKGFYGAAVRLEHLCAPAMHGKFFYAVLRLSENWLLRRMDPKRLRIFAPHIPKFLLPEYEKFIF